MRKLILPLLLLTFGMAIRCGSSNSNATIGRLDKEVRARPDDAQAYADRGMAYLEIAEFVRALADFRRASELQANNAQYHVLCARAALGLKDYAVASARLAKARIFNVALQDQYWVRGQVQQAQGELDAALASFDTGVGIDPRKPVPYVKRAEFLFREQRYTDALRSLYQAALADSNFAPTYNLRGRVYLVSGRLDSAFSDLERAEKLEPQNPRLLIDLGRAYFERKDRRSAERYYREALKYRDRLPAAEVKGLEETLAQITAR
jgi:tetratricopeptide (TPR) repeat protein